MLVEEAWTTREQSATVEWCPKGRPTIAAPPPPALGRATNSVGSIELQPQPPPMHLLHNQQTPVLWGSFWSSFWSRHLWVAHTHRRSWKLSWSPGLRKENWSLSSRLHKPCFYTCNWLCQLSPYRASEWITRAPPDMGGVALAAVDFVGMYTRGKGQARVWAAPRAPQQVQLHECNSGTWVHWISAGVPVKRTSEEAHLSAFTNSLCKSLKVKAAGTTAMCQHAHGWRGANAVPTWGHMRLTQCLSTPQGEQSQKSNA